MPEVRFPKNECSFGWTAAYRQDGTQVTVRIKLQPDVDVDAATLAACRSRWKSGIEGAWSNQSSAGCNFTLQVSFVSSGEHVAVTVKRGPGRSNMRLWYTTDNGRVVAHEVGHLLGNPDEYQDPNCPSRSPVNTGNIMHVVSGPVAPHHCTRICEAIS
jgi:Streptomyces extracellular neutral proteinase (M7) family